jgi:hypothetical protein
MAAAFHHSHILASNGTPSLRPPTLTPTNIRDAHFATIFVHLIFVMYFSYANSTENYQGVQTATFLFTLMTALSLWPILTTSYACSRENTQVSKQRVRTSHIISIAVHGVIAGCLFYSAYKQNRRGIQSSAVALGIMTCLALYPISVREYTCVATE